MDYHALLAHFPKLTPLRYRKLQAGFPELQKLWAAELTELIATGLEPAIADEFISWREKEQPEKILSQLAQEQITTICVGQNGYPPLLAQINDPPPALFIRGNPKALLGTPAIAVVGTRRLSPYGKNSAELLAGGLARHGLTIISGLALGIDSVAHESALLNACPTVAVLGSGVDKNSLFPRANYALAERIIAAGGAIASEYPPGFKPTSYSFPARNRIIAGLTLGTLVIEAPSASGALITARAALDYNRDVFAVPHPITSAAGAGCNRLIQQGALLAQNAEDIIETLNLNTLPQLTPTTKKPPTSAEEVVLLELIKTEPLPVDLLIKKANLPSSAVSRLLTLLEMGGWIENNGGLISKKH